MANVIHKFIQLKVILKINRHFLHKNNILGQRTNVIRSAESVLLKLIVIDFSYRRRKKKIVDCIEILLHLKLRTFSQLFAFTLKLKKIKNHSVQNYTLNCVVNRIKIFNTILFDLSQFKKCVNNFSVELHSWRFTMENVTSYIYIYQRSIKIWFVPATNIIICCCFFFVW